MATATQAHVRQAIEQSGATGTAAEVLQAITSKTVSKSDSSRKVYSDVAVLLDAIGLPGNSIVDAIRDELLVNGPKWVCDQLGGSGLDFSHARMQSQIDTMLAANRLTPQLAAVLKGIGQWSESPLEHFAGQRGLTTTEEDVAAAIQYLTMRSKIDPFVIDLRNGVETGAIATWDDVVALAQARS